MRLHLVKHNYQSKYATLHESDTPLNVNIQLFEAFFKTNQELMKLQDLKIFLGNSCLMKLTELSGIHDDSEIERSTTLFQLNETKLLYVEHMIYTSCTQLKSLNFLTVWIVTWLLKIEWREKFLLFD